MLNKVNYAKNHNMEYCSDKVYGIMTLFQFKVKQTSMKVNGSIKVCNYPQVIPDLGQLPSINEINLWAKVKELIIL